MLARAKRKRTGMTVWTHKTEDILACQRGAENGDAKKRATQYLIGEKKGLSGIKIFHWTTSIYAAEYRL
jgi:hypothetical protein